MVTCSPTKSFNLSEAANEIGSWSNIRPALASQPPATAKFPSRSSVNATQNRHRAARTSPAGMWARWARCRVCRHSSHGRADRPRPQASRDPQRARLVDQRQRRIGLAPREPLAGLAPSGERLISLHPVRLPSGAGNFRAVSASRTRSGLALRTLLEEWDSTSPTKVEIHPVAMAAAGGVHPDDASPCRPRLPACRACDSAITQSS